MELLKGWLRLLAPMTAALLLAFGGPAACERDSDLENAVEDVEEGAEDFGRNVEDTFD